MGLLEEITDFCENNSTLYGFADISKYKEEIISKDLYPYDFAISLGWGCKFL